MSINTVSVALRGRTHIPEATRARILEAARELNYVPNAVARSLVRRSTQTIGVVLTNIMNPIQMRAAQAAEECLVNAGYGTLFAISRSDVEKERRAVEHLQGRQVDGILIYPADHRRVAHLAALRGTGFPVVLLARV
ncbi:MAG: LacI family DNA-binding transcriptional regulator, partial [Acetobacteraceae bacterium]|nr:LacI family DNA-binding transcriptional regulator [Acetobacteraceae bacterium]